jgi:2-ketoarginine methyltransferase
MPHHDTFEFELIEALQPIRGLALANAIWHLFELGLFDALGAGPKPLGALATAHDLDEVRLAAFLKYLRNEGYVSEREDGWHLTERARGLAPFRGWYTMLVGGYGPTFREIGGAMRRGAASASRDRARVGIGSCGISEYDAIPLTRALMAKSGKGCRRLLDLGCGNALYLVEFCKAIPGIEAWGVEPAADTCRAASETVTAAGMTDRIHIVHAGAVEFLRTADRSINPDFTVLGFVLHEILGQEGDEGVLAFLRNLVERFPELDIIVIEVDNQLDNPERMRHGLGLAYYNPYMLFHPFTEQRLERASFWLSIFERAGLEIVASQPADPTVDSTGLEIGYLLRKRRA